LSFDFSSKQVYSNELGVRLSDLVVTPVVTPVSNLVSPAATSQVQQMQRTWLVLAAAAFLVTVPVFMQAPLVRLFPWLSLASTAIWVGLSLFLKRQPTLSLWGNLLLGFSWTWLAGSLYWGWLRWEPFLHLPVEALGLPFAYSDLRRGENRVGNWFYIGSLFGTAMTDLYFYLVNLIPHWRQLMQLEWQEPNLASSLAQTVLKSAVSQIQTPWGIGCAIGLIAILLVVGSLPLRSSQLHWWAFSGAVLSTILVDGLFWLGATVV
jgi:hypothetical protein